LTATPTRKVDLMIVYSTGARASSNQLLHGSRAVASGATLSSSAYFDAPQILPPQTAIVSTYADMIRVHVPQVDARSVELSASDQYIDSRGELRLIAPSGSHHLNRSELSYSPCVRVGARRGAVRGFSRASRKRMFDFMAKVRDGSPSVFVTITYPDVFPVSDATQWKKHTEALRRRLERFCNRFGVKVRGLWRMELKRRLSGLNKGRIAPHWHWLLWLPDKISVLSFCEEISESLKAGWAEIVDSGDSHHEYRGFWVEEIKNRRHAARYVGKYVGKVEDEEYDDLEVGRRWGRLGKFDTSASEDEALPIRSYIEWKRLVVRWLKSVGKRELARKIASGSPSYGVTIYGIGDQTLPVFACDLVRHALEIVKGKGCQWVGVDTT